MKSRLLFPLISVLLGTVLALLLAEFLLGWYQGYKLSREHMDADLLLYDERLGWRLAPNWQGSHRHFDYEVVYTTSPLGYRNSSVGSGGESVLVLGDSFTFGLGVNDTETFVSRLNAQQDERQFINYGVPGTSTDQQLLMMESGLRRTRADRVLLVTYLANDLVDIMLDYPLQAAYGKPRFELSEEGELVLVNVPVPQQAKPPELAQQSLGSYLQRAGGNYGALHRWRLTRLVGAGLDAVPEDFEKTLEEQFAGHLELYRSMLSAMIGQLPPSSRPLEVLLLPGSELIQGSGTISNRYQEYLLGRIMEIRETLEDVRFIDCTGALQGAEQRLNYPNDGHLTKNGHQVVADCLRAELRL